jgi:phosphopentomutase
METTDHTREHVPILVAGRRVRAGAALGTRDSFADIGATVEEALGLRAVVGRSFWREVAAS